MPCKNNFDNHQPSSPSSQDVWFLVSLQGALGYQRHVTICGYPFRIGRSSELALCIPVKGGFPKFMRRFAVRGEKLWLHDLGSTNGSFVNNSQISEPVALQEGDLIQFSDQGFQVGCWSTPGLADTAQGSPVEQELEREVTKRRRTAETLRDRDIHWQTVLTMLNDGIVIFRSAGID